MNIYKHNFFWFELVCCSSLRVRILLNQTIYSYHVSLLGYVTIESLDITVGSLIIFELFRNYRYRFLSDFDLIKITATAPHPKNISRNNLSEEVL